MLDLCFSPSSALVNYFRYLPEREEIKREFNKCDSRFSIANRFDTIERARAKIIKLLFAKKREEGFNRERETSIRKITDIINYNKKLIV